MKRYFAAMFTLACVSAIAASITGAEAERIYNSLPGPVIGPHCTGACIPGRPCDPPCFSSKKGNGYVCTRTEYMKTHRVEFSCDKRGDDRDESPEGPGISMNVEGCEAVAN